MVRATRDVHVRGTRAPAPAAVLMVAIVVVCAVAALGARTALAHSGLAAASPGPGQLVGGEIDVVQLFYGDIILEFDAELEHRPSGEIVPAESVMLSEITAEVRLDEPLSRSGEYVLRHTILSFDDDVVEAEYAFTFIPSADPPILIFFEDDDDGSGLAWWAWAVIGVGALVIAVLAIRLVISLRRARST